MQKGSLTWALKHLVAGKKIRRKSWAKTTFLKLHNNQIIKVYKGRETKMFWFYCFTPDDWSIVDSKHSS